MASILISFRNVKPGAPMLGRLDLIRRTFGVLELPNELAEHQGIAGLTACDRYVYAAVQKRGDRQDGPRIRESSLLVLDRSRFSLCGHHSLRTVRSVHSILIADGVLHVVSTGTNELVRVRLEGSVPVDESVVWRPGPPTLSPDKLHLNSICFYKGDLLVSGFGERAGKLWSSARNGFIANTATGEILVTGIDQPHSVTTVGDAIAYCESRTRSVHIDGTDVIRDLPGYTRGMCVVNGDMFVGTSIGRKVSESTGLVNNPKEGGMPEGQCAIVRVALDRRSVESVLDLSSYAKEIYDLLPIDESSEWPIRSEVAWRDLAIDHQA